jgi:hypothetical protein
MIKGILVLSLIALGTAEFRFGGVSVISSRVTKFGNTFLPKFVLPNVTKLFFPNPRQSGLPVNDHDVDNFLL